jgi:hypothetical protein
MVLVPSARTPALLHAHSWALDALALLAMAPLAWAHVDQRVRFVACSAPGDVGAAAPRGLAYHDEVRRLQQRQPLL